jgi:hypothetical protein
VPSALAARAARPGAAAGPRQRICDGYGLQLETANMPGDHINERSCAIRDVVARDLRSASMETTGLFAHVLPQAVLARPRAGITVPQTPPPPRASACQRRRRARRLSRHGTP